MSIWKWADSLTPVSPESRLTLGEGNTPVVRSRRIGPDAGLANLHFKLEPGNPTGSYKDRFAAAAVTDMISRGTRRCIATSSGNTGSALAAYCAVAGALQAAEQGDIRRDATIVCLITGSGFKDEASLAEMIEDTDCPTLNPADIGRRLT